MPHLQQAAQAAPFARHGPIKAAVICAQAAVQLRQQLLPGVVRLVRNGRQVCGHRIGANRGRVERAAPVDKDAVAVRGERAAARQPRVVLDHTVALQSERVAARGRRIGKLRQHARMCCNRQR
eukprot:351937-Chlamydomonas_euryale.AAC.17